MFLSPPPQCSHLEKGGLLPAACFEDKGDIGGKCRGQQALLAGGRCGLSACVGLGGGIPEPQAWTPHESLTRQVTLSMAARTLV